MAVKLEDRAREAFGRMSEQRVLICRALEKSSDHPDAEQLHQRLRQRDPKLAIATVYRTLRALEDLDLVIKHDFGDGRTRFEVKGQGHHDHLIDLETGQVIEFRDPELEALKQRIADRLGYTLESHSLELYGRVTAG